MLYFGYSNQLLGEYFEAFSELVPGYAKILCNKLYIFIDGFLVFNKWRLYFDLILVIEARHAPRCQLCKA